MAYIGSFTPHKDGFIGRITTLTLDIQVEIVLYKPESPHTSPHGPRYRIMSDKAQIGVAWLRVSEALKVYLSVVLDDPSFAAPIHANLVEESEGKHVLIWSRR